MYDETNQDRASRRYEDVLVIIRRMRSRSMINSQTPRREKGALVSKGNGTIIRQRIAGMVLEGAGVADTPREVFERSSSEDE